jgi:hypothetical protein
MEVQVSRATLIYIKKTLRGPKMHYLVPDVKKHGQRKDQAVAFYHYISLNRALKELRNT